MIAADAKNWRAAGAAKSGEIFRLTIENHPGDPRSGGGAAYVRQSRTADGLEDDRVGMLRGITLNDVQKLLTLVDGIVARVSYFDVHAEALRGRFRCSCLFDLEIIIVGDQRYQEPEPFHGRHAPREKETGQRYSERGGSKKKNYAKCSFRKSCAAWPAKMGERASSHLSLACMKRGPTSTHPSSTA